MRHEANIKVTLREFIEQASVNIERRFNEVAIIYPIFHFVDGEGREIVMPAPSGDKDTMIRLARDILARRNATRCLLMDEAWMIDAQQSSLSDFEEAEKILSRGGSIKNHPARIEAVMFMAEDQNEGLIGAYREIVRKINSRPRLGPLSYIPQGGQSEGRYVGLLPRGKLSS